MAKIRVYRVTLSHIDSGTLAEWDFTDYHHAMSFMETGHDSMDYPLAAKYSLSIEEKEDDF